MTSPAHRQVKSGYRATRDAEDETFHLLLEKPVAHSACHRRAAWQDSGVEESKRYPVVRLGPAAGPRLVWENFAILFVLQASQGNIGPEVLGISVEATQDEVTVHVCLREENEAVREDLDDLVSEFEGIQSGVVEPPVRITIAKHVGDTDPSWPGYYHQRIFLINDRMRDA
jgi:hypothetical protein